MKNPKTILITGASSGIGHALAQLYAAPGVTLLLTGRDVPRLAEIESLCRAKGATVKTSGIPVTERAALAAQLLAWDDAHQIELVLANAGISGGHGKIGDETEQRLRDIMATNIDGMFNTVNPLIDRLRGRKRGQIALLSSIAGFRGLPSAPAYSTSKNAVRAYGEALRPLLKKDNVGVSVICHGKAMTARFPASPRRMIPAALTADIMKGMAKSFLSVSGVLMKPGQMTLDLILYFAPSLATALAKPVMPCFAAT